MLRVAAVFQARLVLVPLVVLALGALGGCPPALDEPERFPALCSGAETVQQLFGARCDGPSCHGPGAKDPVTGEDNVQLVGVDPVKLIGPHGTPCEAGVSYDLVTPGEPEHSHVFLKVGGAQGAGVCGATMPLNRPALCKADIALLREWIAEQKAEDAAVPDASHEAAVAGGDAAPDASDATSEASDAASDGDALSDAAGEGGDS